MRIAKYCKAAAGAAAVNVKVQPRERVILYIYAQRTPTPGSVAGRHALRLRQSPCARAGRAPGAAQSGDARLAGRSGGCARCRRSLGRRSRAVARRPFAPAERTGDSLPDRSGALAVAGRSATAGRAGAAGALGDRQSQPRSQCGISACRHPGAPGPDGHRRQHAGAARGPAGHARTTRPEPRSHLERVDAGTARSVDRTATRQRRSHHTRLDRSGAHHPALGRCATSECTGRLARAVPEPSG